MLDGRNGKVLWQMNATYYEMTSDLVLRTTEKHRDAFVFRIEGVNGPDMNMVRESRTLLIGASGTDAQYLNTRYGSVMCSIKSGRGFPQLFDMFIQLRQHA